MNILVYIILDVLGKEFLIKINLNRHVRYIKVWKLGINKGQLFVFFFFFGAL